MKSIIFVIFLIISKTNLSFNVNSRKNNSNIYLKRKLQINSKYIITAKAKGKKGDIIQFINSNKPNNVYINNSTNSKGSINKITLEEDGEINIKMVWNSGTTDFYRMFADCNKLISIDLSNYNTKGVTSYSHTFVNCTSLEFINTTNINMESTIYLNGMFKNCHSLKRLDLRNIKAPNVIDMSVTFSECSSLTSLDLSYFNAPKLKDFSTDYITLRNCVSLFLNLSNFYGDSITNFNGFFFNCNTS